MRRFVQLLCLSLVAGSLLAAAPTQARPKPHHHHHHHHQAVKHGYLVDQVQLPVSSTDAQTFGVDLNGDGKVDNKLGQLLVGLASQGFDIQGTLNAALSGGTLVSLLSVQTKNLKNAEHARVRLFRGLPGTTTVDPAAAVTDLKAKIVKKLLVPTPGTVHLTLPALLPSRPPITVDLVQGRVAATCKVSGCTGGRIVGAIPSAEMDERFAPELGAALRVIVARDCPTTPPDPCTSGSAGGQVLSIFDADHDGAITDQEVRDNAIYKGLTAPDLDLVGGDGVADSLSVGVAFTAKAADVTGD